MAKHSITYTDLDGSAPKTKWHGREFITGKAIEVDDENPRDQALIEAAEGNDWFEVERGAAEKTLSAPYDKGGKAAEDDKDRSVPPAYRGKPEGDAWLAGYDDRLVALGKVAPATTATAGKPLSPGGAANALTKPQA